jgi:hypothetical protein
VYNKAIVMYSKSLALQYGEPFHVIHKLVTPSKAMSVNEVRDLLNALKCSFIQIEKNLRASGNGEEHELKRFTKIMCLDEAGNVIANSDLFGYACDRFKEEDILYLVTQSLDSKLEQ